MKLNPYLDFSGRCAEAFKFYEETLGGNIVALISYGDSPMRDHVPPEWHAKILHAQLEIDGQTLMGADLPPEYPVEQIKGMTVSLALEDEFEAERIFDALAEGGQVRAPLTQTFWAARFSMVIDRYGVPWMISGGMED